MQKREQLASATRPGYHTVARMIQQGEQREESRENNGERLFIQITQAADRYLVGKTISCTAVDASAHGIKFKTDEFVPVGCMIDLWVDDHSRPGKFFLSGDVRWTQKADEDQSIVGVRLLEGVATDIDQWRTIYGTVIS